MKRFLRLIATVCGIAIAIPNLTIAQEKLEKVTAVEGITEYKLSNGLKVLLFPDSSRKKVTVNLTILCGSRHEGYGETGMAHLLEHMLFKGTPTFPNVPKSLADHGANFNGTTWLDRTNYYETMPSGDENLEFGIKLEADRMVNSLIRREDLISEMTVVRNEFEIGENSPDRILNQRMMAVAYEWHNYGKSTIGNRSDIEKVPVENLREFYKKYYRTDNSILIVAGDFEEAKAKEYIVKYFGAIKKPSTPLSNTYTQEPAQDGERIVNLRRVGSVGVVGVIYHIPSGPNPECAACQILEDCLTAQPSGRLYKTLIATKKATNLAGDASAWHDPGVIEISAKVEKKDGLIEDARDTMIETIENLAKNPITEEEVARSKQKFAKMKEEQLSSTDQFAIGLSEWAGAGDWRLYFLHRDRLEKVTAEDVNKAAAKYLTRNNRTVGMFIPTEKAERVAIPESTEIAKMLEGYKGRAVVAAGESFDSTPENIEKKLVRGELGSLKTAFLPKKTRGEQVEMQINLRYGNEQSLNNHTTAAALLPSLLPRGCNGLTRQQITDKLDKLGATVQFTGGNGLVAVSIKVKKPNLAETLELVVKILREPTFPESEFTVLKNERIQRLASQKKEPMNLAMNSTQRKLSDYPKTNIRYVPTIDESIERLNAVTLDQVKDLYKNQLGANVGEIVAVGDFVASDIVKILTPAFSDWKSKVDYKRIERVAQKRDKGELEVIETPDKANAILIGALTMEMNDLDPEYAAMQMGNYLLGGAPLASRLSNRVRGEKGLSYAIGSQFRADPMDKMGVQMLFAMTNPINMGKVDTTIREEVEKFLKEGLSLEELESGKKGLLETMKVERTEDANLTFQIAESLFVGRKFDYYSTLEKKIESLSPAEIQKAFQKNLDPKKLIIIQAGDFKKK